MYELLYRSDALSSLLLIFVLTKLGGLMVGRQPQLIRWGERAAAAMFIGFGAVAAMRELPTTTGEILGVVWHSLLAAGLVLGATWIGLPVAFFAWDHTGGALIRCVRDSCRARRRRRAEREARQREDERRLRSAQEWERQAPQRERQRLEAEQRAIQAQTAQQRREQSRLDCELFYALHAPEVQGRLPPVDFRRFVKRYMRDDMRLEEVEARGKQLQGIIKQHSDKCDPPAKFNSLGDIAAWYEQQKDQAESIGEERLRRLVLAQLKRRYSDLTTNLLEVEQ